VSLNRAARSDLAAPISSLMFSVSFPTGLKIEMAIPFLP
jgi:hypothetical protein